MDYDKKLERQLSELTTSDLASPSASNPDEDIVFRIDESDTDSLASTATSLDSGFGGFRREPRMRTMTECEVRQRGGIRHVTYDMSQCNVTCVMSNVT